MADDPVARARAHYGSAPPGQYRLCVAVVWTYSGRLMRASWGFWWVTPGGASQCSSEQRMLRQYMSSTWHMQRAACHATVHSGSLPLAMRGAGQASAVVHGVHPSCACCVYLCMCWVHVWESGHGFVANFPSTGGGGQRPEKKS